MVVSVLRLAKLFPISVKPLRSRRVNVFVSNFSLYRLNAIFMNLRYFYIVMQALRLHFSGYLKRFGQAFRPIDIQQQ